MWSHHFPGVEKQLQYLVHRRKQKYGESKNELNDLQLLKNRML